MITEPTTDTPAAAPARPRVWIALRALVTTLVVLGLVTVACPGLLGAWSAQAQDAVPRSIDLSWHWQASALQDPPGLASVVATVDDPAGGVDILAPIADRAGVSP